MVKEIEIQLKTRVAVISDSEGHWFARGLDIDYAAQGRSYLEVQKAFETGFVATVQEHLAHYGHLNYFMRPVPPDVLAEFEDATRENAGRALLPLDDDSQIAEIDYYEVAA